MKKLSEQLKETISDCGMTNYQVAIRSRIHQSQISRFLRGKSRLNLDTIDKIGQALNLQITIRSNLNEPPK